MGVVARIYDRFELELAPAAQAAIQAYVDANPKGKHGKHAYDLSSYGLTEADVSKRFEFYLSNERWPISN